MKPKLKIRNIKAKTESNALLLGVQVMKRLATAFISILVLTALGGTLLCELTTANFLGPTTPATDPPIVSIVSPSPNTTYKNEVLLHINITFLNPNHKEMNYVGYTLDNQEHVISKTYRENEMNWSTTLQGLTEGTHTLQVTASCRSYYMTPTSGGYFYYRVYWGYSDTINFTLVYPPQISILSLQNKTYETNNIQLNFTINEPVSKIEYSIDAQKNVTITENTTLTGLADGAHNITIYATDTDGNTGASKTINFTIKPFPTTLIIGPITSAAIISVGLLVYFKKHKNKTPSNT